MSDRFKKMFPGGIDDILEGAKKEREKFQAGSVIPVDGGEKIVQRLGQLFGVQGTGDEGRIQGRDLISAAVGEDTLPLQALEALGSGAEAILDPSNLFTLGGAGAAKAMAKEVGKRAAAQGIAQTLPDFKTTGRPGSLTRKVETTVSGQPEPGGIPLGREPLSPNTITTNKAQNAMAEEARALRAELKKKDELARIARIEAMNNPTFSSDVTRKTKTRYGKGFD